MNAPARLRIRFPVPTSTSLPTRWRLLIAVLGTIAGLAGADGAGAQEDRWRLRLSAAVAGPTSGEADDSQVGPALGLEYRLSPRLGVELSACSVELDERVDVTVITILPLAIDASYRMTPLLARLNFHLTPGGRVDLYAGPVAGYVLFSGEEVRYRSGSLPGPVTTATAGADAEERWTWGAGLGLDVALGRGGSLVTAGVTYLDLPIALEERGVRILEPGAKPALRQEAGRFRGDVDPLVVHLGYGLSF
jgi:hypothetical protein